MDTQPAPTVRIGTAPASALRAVVVQAHRLGITLASEPGPKVGLHPSIREQWYVLLAPTAECGMTLAIANYLAGLEADWDCEHTHESQVQRIVEESVRAAVSIPSYNLECLLFRRPDSPKGEGVLVMRASGTGEVRYYSVPFSTRDLEIAVVEAAWKLAKRRVT